MKLAVLLLQNSDLPRATTYSRDWVHMLVNHTTGFFTEQSGGRKIIEYRVFDWFTLPMTGAEWMNAGFGVGPIVRPMVEAGLDVDLSHYTHFALVIDRADAGSAAVSPSHPQYVHVAAQDLDPALLAHEIGHFLGANHANLDTPSGPSEYDDQFCIMGREGAKYSFTHAPLNLTDAAGNVSTELSDSGPGMVAPTLLGCGWLDPASHGVDVSAPLQSQQGRAEFRIEALRGAPPSDRPKRVFAFASGVTNQFLTVEARWRDEYDRGMPDPGEGGAGWVLAHEASALGPGTSTTLLASLPARQGASAYVPKAQLGIAVKSVDAQAGVVSLALEVERFTSRYASIWEPLDGVAWQARHGISPAEYQQTFTALATEGYRLVDVDVHSSKGSPRFSGIWRKEGGPAWEARHGLNSDQYQHTFNDLTARGFRPLCVSGYAEGGQARYAAVWSKEGGPAWIARHGLDANQYQNLFGTLPSQGFRPWRVNGYTVAGQDRFATIWRQTGGERWLARHGLTADEYQRLFNELASQGWRLIDVSGYGANGQDRYVCIWELVGGPAWEARHGLTPFLHQQEFNAQIGRGHRLTRISGHNPFG
ncbi:hypothetical protein JM946_17630 [Steroidobacter sp. S1-65]|uniref:Uncharacterized protein n=1 Tax=Steroidobacter gossypii TaxID=2805490 RepID=A0ABS1WZZ5_9GAMM|nr:hypothetical protein [Steroidobacter gossypii]MBM0106553.1 hypothetical protein [Steroidobacter gossypii]